MAPPSPLAVRLAAAKWHVLNVTRQFEQVAASIAAQPTEASVGLMAALMNDLGNQIANAKRDVAVIEAEAAMAAQA
jgi:hypothetical protein